VPITGRPITGKRRYPDRFVYVINLIFGRLVMEYVSLVWLHQNGRFENRICLDIGT
jgi:hypothetical protein